MFVNFEDPHSGSVIAVNSDHVRAVRPGRGKAITVLVFSEGSDSQQEVLGEFRHVVDKLNGNKTLTLMPSPRARAREARLAR